MSPERIKTVRKHMIISSILLLIMGIAFIVWPEKSAVLMARLVSVLIIAVGVFELVLFIIGKRKGVVDVPAIITGTILTGLGIFLLIRSDAVLELFNIIFGIVILVIGIDHILQAVFIIRHVRTLWWISLIVGVAALGLGALIIVNPFSAVRTGMVLMGITMVLEALGGIWNLPALKPKPGELDSIKDVTPGGGND